MLTEVHRDAVFVTSNFPGTTTLRPTLNITKLCDGLGEWWCQENSTLLKSRARDQES